MKQNATDDELIAKEKELFTLSVKTDQDRIKILVRDLRLDSASKGGYIYNNQYTKAGKEITLLQLLQIAAFLDDGEYFQNLIENNDISNIDFYIVLEAALAQGLRRYEEVLPMIARMVFDDKIEDPDHRILNSLFKAISDSLAKTDKVLLQNEVLKYQKLLPELFIHLTDEGYGDFPAHSYCPFDVVEVGAIFDGVAN